MKRVAFLIVILTCAPLARAEVVALRWDDTATPLHYQLQLPNDTPRDARLVFRAYVATFALYIDDERFYAFDDARSAGRLTLHVATLPREAAGKRIGLRIAGTPREPYISEPLLADARELPQALTRIGTAPLRHDVADIAIGAILFVLGVISFGVSQVRRRGSAEALPWFGAMATLYGARLLVDSPLPLFLGARSVSMQYAESWITYVIPIVGWTLAWRLIGDGWKSSMRWQVYAFVLYAPLAILSDLVTGRPGSAEGANNVLVILGGINIFLNLLSARRWQSRELRVVFAGAMVFLLFAIVNNLAALNLLPWGEANETPGFLAFVAALGYAATRNFIRGEREGAALASELATARDIQLSLLPTSMPSVEGLRFHAHFDPASSVAGDLYDFLEREGRVGVLVADVSGHGVPAALIASMVKIAVSSHSRLSDDPAALLREVNRTLRGQVRRAFVTATYLAFSARSAEVANAGHPPPLLHRRGTIRELGPSGVILGRFEASYPSETIALEPGDRILAYTDGVIEARNARGEAFGEKRLHNLLASEAGDDIARTIAAAVRNWRADGSDVDDVTLVVVDVI